MAPAEPAELLDSQPPYKVYKRRFWGLAQLVLLNIVVSWDVCAIPAISRELSLTLAPNIVADIRLHFDHCCTVLRCL